MKTRFIFIVMAAIMVCGCQKVETSDFVPGGSEAKVFTATIDDTATPATKTSLDINGNVRWKQGDRVSVFAGTSRNQQYQVSEDSDGKTVATLNPVSGSGSSSGSGSTSGGGSVIANNVGYYPYVAAAAITTIPTGYTISGINLPSTQTYVENSFGNGEFPMVAVTEKTEVLNLKFKNVLGGVKLQLKGTAKVASIRITGKNSELLCGPADVHVASDGTPTITMTGVGSTANIAVMLDCGAAGVQLNTTTATAFIIALPPVEMAGGFTVTVTDTEGGSMEISTTKTQNIVRSSMLKMPVVTYATPIPTPNYVDLALPSGKKWADRNLGARAPEDFGDYYAWGELEPYYSSLDPITWKAGKAAGYDWASYKWNSGTDGNVKLTKYNQLETLGTVDNKTVLDAEDDAAHVVLGDNWRMPTDEDWIELNTYCHSKNLTIINNVYGLQIKGTNGNTIFLPAAGYIRLLVKYWSLSDQRGYYWSSSLVTSGYESSKYVRGRNITNDLSVSVFERPDGYSIRPIYVEPAASN